MSFKTFSVSCGSSALESTDDGAGRRLLVVVEVVLRELDQVEALLLFLGRVGLRILVCSLLESI
jgi:hypothetical protein